MSARVPRHRAQKSVQERRAERLIMVSLIVFPLLVWFAVHTGNGLVVVFSVIGALMGTWMSGKWKILRRSRDRREPE